MAKFGKYSILDETVKHFEKEPDWFWKVKPATSGMELNVQKFLSHGRIVVSPDGSRRDYPPTNTEIAMREIALTFGGTNIPMSEDKPVADGGDPILKIGAPVDQIEKVLADMHHDLLMEIWDMVGEANPGWGPSHPKVRTTPEKEE